jgi:hypothetical protein
VTGEVKTYTNTFEYEVGERSVTVSPTKMNVFYIGVDNPVEVSASGVSSNQLKVSMSGAGGGSIKQGCRWKYYRKRERDLQKLANMRISMFEAPGLKVTKQFRVKRIPDPIAKLGDNWSVDLLNYRCFQSTKRYHPNDWKDLTLMQDVTSSKVSVWSEHPEGMTRKWLLTKEVSYGPEAQRLVDQASPGDRFFFEECEM